MYLVDMICNLFSYSNTAVSNEPRPVANIFGPILPMQHIKLLTTHSDIADVTNAKVVYIESQDNYEVNLHEACCDIEDKEIKDTMHKLVHIYMKQNINFSHFHKVVFYNTYCEAYMVVYNTYIPNTDLLININVEKLTYLLATYNYEYIPQRRFAVTKKAV